MSAAQSTTTIDAASGLATPPPTELAFRESDGLEVSLLWFERVGFLSVAVHDAKTGEAFELVLTESDNALDVFNHPFAYAAFRGLDNAAAASKTALPAAA
jgi:hypothetical protein